MGAIFGTAKLPGFARLGGQSPVPTRTHHVQ